MGFLKRFFSLGSKKSKKGKKSRNQEAKTDDSGRLVPNRENDGGASRLLRSSSAHFTVVSEIDYTSLPPLPHPINSVLNSPAVTPARSTTSLQRQGTYTVTVHGRTLHSCTEFPNANPSLNEERKDPAPHRDVGYYDESPTRARFDPKSVPLTPHDQSRILRLRKDPSVASLLNMYDENGRIRSNAFSNTPPTPAPVEGGQDGEGRLPRQRTGSTLRQLLGAPDSDHTRNNSALMGDISWADRFIGDHESMASSNASSSSLALETPKDPYPDTLSNPHVILDTAFSLDNTLSKADASVNYPTISSMEVELSSSTDVNVDDTVAHFPQRKGSVHSPAGDPETPQRPATEIFGFLTERRKSIREREQSNARLHEERPLPAIPTGASTFSSSSSSNPSTNPTTPYASSSLAPSQPNSSPDTSTSDTSSGQIHTATLTKLTPVMNPLSNRSTDTLNTLNLFRSYTPTASRTVENLADTNTLALPVQTTGSSHGSSGSQPSRIPKGPRPAPLASSSRAPHSSEPPLSRSMSNVPAAPVKQSRIPKVSAARRDDPFTAVPRQRRVHGRTASHASDRASSPDGSDPEAVAQLRKPTAQSRGTRKTEIIDKENSPVSTTPSHIPKTPARSHSRAIFDARHPNHFNGDPPSPASSSELSPLTQDMMANLRKQRQKRVGMQMSARDAYAAIGR